MSETELVLTLTKLFRVERLLKLRRVDPDWINTEGRDVFFARDMRKLCFDPEDPMHGGAEVPQISKGMKTDPVRSQDSRNQFGTARMAAKNFVGRKRSV